MAAVYKPLKEGYLVADQYRIVRKIGTGGFGDVYLALHEAQQRQVAIKTLRQEDNPHLPDIIQRFQREVSLARKLDHPNIIRTFENGRLASGQLYMVMEYVRGQELESVLRGEGRFNLERATRIVSQILDALAEAHAMGVVHRDLKPSNVMLTRSGVREDVVKLLDFGIAKAFDGTYADLTAQNLTEGVGFGTPQYMAPEQILGVNIGPHTDLYATGLIWIELVTGSAPMLARDPTDTINLQLNEPVPIPPWLAASPVGHILQKALQKEWEDRYDSAVKMYRDIEKVVRGGQTALSGIQSPPVVAAPVAESPIDGDGPPTARQRPGMTEVTAEPTLAVDSGPTVVVEREYQSEAKAEDIASMPTAMVGPDGVMPGAQGQRGTLPAEHGPGSFEPRTEPQQRFVPRAGMQPPGAPPQQNIQPPGQRNSEPGPIQREGRQGNPPTGATRPAGQGYSQPGPMQSGGPAQPGPAAQGPAGPPSHSPSSAPTMMTRVDRGHSDAFPPVPSNQSNALPVIIVLVTASLVALVLLIIVLATM